VLQTTRIALFYLVQTGIPTHNILH